MKKFSKSLQNPAAEIINFEKKKMTPLSGKNCKSYEIQKICYIKNEEADYCHHTGKYRSTEDRIYNLRNLSNFSQWIKL